MDLTQLADLGEFIGGVAVLVTLIYLAVQMRQGNVLAREEAIHRAVNTWSAERRLRADASVSEVLAKAHDDEPLTRQEQIQLRGYLDELTYASWAAYSNRRFMRSDEVAPAAVARLVGDSSSWREAWSEIAADLRSYGLGDFAGEVESRLNARR